MLGTRPSTTSLVRKAGGAPEVSLDTGTGRTTPISSLAPVGMISGASVCWEASQAANNLLVTGRFRAELLPILQAAGQSVQAETNVSIAIPVSVDWEDVILYEGFTVRIAPVNDMSTEEEHALFVQFPRADGWLKDDFIPAVVALIELAEVILNCDRLFVCVGREVAEANSLVRSLMYAGFTVSPFSEPSNYLVLEYETE